MRVKCTMGELSLPAYLAKTESELICTLSDQIVLNTQHNMPLFLVIMLYKSFGPPISLDAGKVHYGRT